MGIFFCRGIVLHSHGLDHLNAGLDRTSGFDDLWKDRESFKPLSQVFVGISEALIEAQLEGCLKSASADEISKSYFIAHKPLLSFKMVVNCFEGIFQAFNFSVEP